MQGQGNGTADWEITEDGLWVATRAFLLRRGYCCGSGCRNCPYRGTPLDRYTPRQRRDSLGPKAEEP